MILTLMIWNIYFIVTVLPMLYLVIKMILIMVTVYRFNYPPLTITLDNIKNIYSEQGILKINLKNGEEIVGYNVIF